jgi:hypothetical protein
MGDGEVDSVEVVHQNAETEKPCNPPAPPGNLNFVDRYGGRGQVDVPIISG